MILSILSFWRIRVNELCMTNLNILTYSELIEAESIFHNFQSKDMTHENRQKDLIIIIGASYAAGWNLERIVGLRVVNKGVGGEQSFEMRNRFEKDIISLNPRAVIIWGFINDIFNVNQEEIDATLEKTKNNFVEMVKLAQDNGIIPILTTDLTIRGKKSWPETLASWIGKILGKESYQDYVNKHVLAMNQWISKYAKAQDLPLLDLQPILSDEQGIRKREYAVEDGSHISPKGYDKLTSYTQKMLGDSLMKY